MSIKHKHQSAVPNDPTKDISSNEWNDSHDISLTKAELNQAITDGDVQFVGDAPAAHTQTASTISDFAQAVAVSGVYPTLASMTGNTAILAGTFVRTLGYWKQGDRGTAVYSIMTLAAYGSTPNNMSDHLMTNGLVAKLLHEGTLAAEACGCGNNREMSARLQAAWYSLTAWQDAIGSEAPFMLTLSSTGTLQNQVVLNHPVNGRVANSNLDFSTSKLTAIVGGNLSSTNAMLSCRLKNGNHSWGELNGGKFAATYDFFGVGGSRGFNPVARNYKGKGIRVRGASGSFALYNPLCTEYSQTDAEFTTQSNFTSIGISAEDGDWSCYNANVLFNRAGVCFGHGGTDPVQVHFVNAHLVGGNPLHGGAVLPFADMILVENYATRENHFDICYFDNGIIKDYTQTLNITGGHYVANGAATLSEPKIKMIANVPNQTIMNDINIRDIVGLASVGFVNDGANTWAGNLSGIATYYADMSQENTAVSLKKTQYNIYPSDANTVEVNLKTQGMFDTIWNDGAAEVSVRVDPSNGTITNTVGIVRVSNASSDRSLFLGTGDNGISETNGVGGVLNLHSGGEKKWKSDGGGDFLPAVTGIQSLGGSALRLLKTWANSLGIGSGGVTINAGTGSPEGVLGAGVGSTYHRADGSAGTSLYVKQSGGSGTTGWVAEGTFAGLAGKPTTLAGYGITDALSSAGVSDAAFVLQDNVDPTKQLRFELSGIGTATTRTLFMPSADGAIATLNGASQVFANTTSFSAASVTVGTSTAASTYGLGTGATTSGQIKAVNIGIAGLSGSTSNIAIGSALAGALGTLTINSPVVVFGSNITSISLPDAATFFVDSAVPTKRVQFDASLVTAATTRTVQFPDTDGIMVVTPTGRIETTDLVNLSVATGKLAANAVLNGKLAQMPAKTFKGNKTAATADPSDLTLSEVKLELGLGDNTPIPVLIWGQSNIRSSADSTGGDQTLDPMVFMWNQNSLNNSLMVAGTQWLPAAFGTPPLNIGGGPWANSMGFHFAKKLRERTGRPVYVVQIAAGSHNIESFITAATRTANGWSVGGGDQDLTAFMYPGLATALAAIPGSPTKFEYAVGGQGEANQDEQVELYAAKLTAVYTDLANSGLIDLNQTPIAHTKLLESAGNPRRLRFHNALLRAQENLPTLRIVSSDGLPPSVVDDVHYTGNGLVVMGGRCEAAMAAPPERVDYFNEPLCLGVDYGLRHFTDQANMSGADISKRPAVALSAGLTIENNATLGWCFRASANTSQIFASRRKFSVPPSGVITIAFEALTTAVGATIDMRISVSQFNAAGVFTTSKNFTPANSPLTDAMGRTVFRGRIGRSIAESDIALDAGTEFFSYNVFMGVGADDETFAFNLLEMGADQFSYNLPSATIMGRVTAGSGPQEALTAGQVSTLLGLGTLATTSTANLATQVTGVLPPANGGTGQATLPMSLGALQGYTETITAAGTTTLTAASTQFQTFTGTLAQTVVVPGSGLVVAGFTFIINNLSTGSLSIQAATSGVICTILANEVWMLTCDGTGGGNITAWVAVRLYSPASGGSSAPGGSTTQIQYNNAGAFAGATLVEIEENQLRLDATILTAPAAGGIKVGSNADNQPTWMGPDGVARLFKMPQGQSGIKPTTGAYTRLSISNGTLNAQATGVNQIRLTPAVVMPFDVTYTAFVIEVTTLLAASLAKIVIYESDPLTNRPTNLLYESGNLDCSTIGVKVATTTITFRAGLTYWVGTRSQGSQSLRAVNHPTQVPGRLTSGTGVEAAVVRNLTFATGAPNPWNYVGTEVSDFNLPHMVWGIAA